MRYKVQVLAYAKNDYREIRGYVRRKFGDPVWTTIEEDSKEIFKQLADMPLTGLVLCLKKLKRLVLFIIVNVWSGKKESSIR